MVYEIDTQETLMLGGIVNQTTGKQIDPLIAKDFIKMEYYIAEKEPNRDINLTYY